METRNTPSAEGLFDGRGLVSPASMPGVRPQSAAAETSAITPEKLSAAVTEILSEETTTLAEEADVLMRAHERLVKALKQDK